MNRDNRFCGIFSSTDIREVIFTIHLEDLVVMRDIMVSDILSPPLLKIKYGAFKIDTEKY